MQLVELQEHASIGRLNWVTAYPLDHGPHFRHLSEREPQLELGEHAAITNRHIIDCTEKISIGAFTTVAGFRSQLLTHSIDLPQSRQDAKPIAIGRYCFVGTSCVMLGGTSMPDYSVAGAYALLNRAYTDSYRLYAGVPAKPMGPLDPEMKYFNRTAGYVV
jgi:acetyltransferase-like isoleucine patch superfamily enzyme